jgi:hypothetical protein
VTVTVTSASVNIGVTIATSDASGVETALSDSLADAGAATIFLQTAVPDATVTAAPLISSAQVEDNDYTAVIAGAAGGGLVALCCISYVASFFLCHDALMRFLGIFGISTSKSPPSFSPKKGQGAAQDTVEV